MSFRIGDICEYEDENIEAMVRIVEIRSKTVRVEIIRIEKGSHPGWVNRMCRLCNPKKLRLAPRLVQSIWGRN